MQSGTSFYFMWHESVPLKHSHLNVQELKFIAYFLLQLEDWNAAHYAVCFASLEDD